VQALADDVRRYLRDEAVLARPDTMVQRMHRWAGHHRTTMLLTVCLLGLLLVVTGTTLLIGSTVALEWRRRVALRHEEAVTEVLSLASVGAGRIRGTVGMAEAALTGLSYAAEAGLDRPLRTELEAGLKFPTDPLNEEPEKLRPSPLYRRKVSLERPSFAGPDRSETMDLQAKLLTAISHSFARPLLDSATEERLKRAERFEQIARKGAPVRWVKIATSDGLVATMPGTGSYAAGVDGRKLDWYRRGDDPSVQWSDPHVDPDGTGLVLTGTRPLYKLTTQIGTAAIDLTAQTLVDLLEPPPGAREALLVDGKGQVVLWSDLDAPGATSYAPKELPLPELQDPLRERPEGVLEVGGTIAAWAPVNLLDWRYLVLVDSSGAGEVKARWAGVNAPR
jgi:hypothetical protein